MNAVSLSLALSFSVGVCVCLPVSHSKYLIALYSPFCFLWWCEIIKCLHDEIKWGEALWLSIRLLLTSWPRVRRRVMYSRWSWIIEPGWCQWLDVRSRWCRQLGMPGGTEWDGVRFHHATQNSTQFKTSEFFTSGIFHLIFLGHSWLQVTKTMESKTTDKGGLLSSILSEFHWCINILHFHVFSLIFRHSLRRIKVQ